MRFLLLSLVLTLAGCSLDLARLYGDSGPDAGRLDAPFDADLDAPPFDADLDAPPFDARADAPDGSVGPVLLTFQRTFALAGTPTSLAASADGELVAVGIGGSLESVDTVSVRVTGSCGFDGTVVNHSEVAGPVAVGQLNADSVLDFVGTTTSGIQVVFGVTGGGFSPGAPISLAASAAVIATGDLDENTTLDLVVFSRGNIIQPLLSSGAGSFSAASEISLSGTFLDGLVAPLDLLPGPDLAGLQSDTLYLSTNAGAGGFGTVMSVALAETASRLTVGDLGGSAPSLVVIGPSHLWLGSEFGVVDDLGPVGTDQRDVVLAELDGVSPPEIVIAEGAGRLRIYGWSGGALSALSDVAVSGTPTELAAVNIDGDAADELLVATEEGELALFSATCRAP